MSRSREFHALFRDLRIVDQRRYYEDRRDEYRRARRQAVAVRNTLLFAAAAAGAVAQLASGTGRAAWAVAGAVLGALAAAVTGYESIIGFGKLEKLYGDAAHNLAEAELDWDTKDPEGDLTPGYERVETILRDENGQWGQLAVESAAPISPSVSE